MDINFKHWLLDYKGYSPRVVSNIGSRLKRAAAMTDSEAIKSSTSFMASVARSSSWEQIPKSSKSGMLRSVHLYEEFLSHR